MRRGFPWIFLMLCLIPGALEGILLYFYYYIYIYYIYYIYKIQWSAMCFMVFKIGV